jgi:hypothetical protein
MADQVTEAVGTGTDTNMYGGLPVHRQGLDKYITEAVAVRILICKAGCQSTGCGRPVNNILYTGITVGGSTDANLVNDVRMDIITCTHMCCRLSQYSHALSLDSF